MSKPFKSQFDLMAEAYGNVNYSKQRVINEDTAGKTVIGYPPSEDYEEGEEKAYKYTVIENDKEASIQPMEYRQPEGDLIKIVKSDGIVKKCYQHPEGREWTVESDRPIDFNQAGSWTWDEDSEEDYEEPGPQLGGDIDPGEFDYQVAEPIEDAEEAGFNRKQLDELEDIVHAILDKRDHEDRAAKHEDGEH
jgi:hypothetical protein